MIKNSTAFVGLDLGDKRSNVFILDQGGELIEETRIPITWMSGGDWMEVEPSVSERVVHFT